MDWHAPLITLYLAVCHHWQEGGWAQAQRHAPYADLDFTDEEVVTIYLFAVALEQKRQIKDIHRHAGRYWRDWFPRLPGYGAYVQRLNRLADCFPALLERFCETGETVSFAGLVDSMPVILARQGRRFNAKVAPELASSGYCPTKRLYYHGVKVHVVGDVQSGTLPSPRFIGLAPSRGYVNPSSPSSIGSRRKPASRWPARYVLPRVFSSMSSGAWRPPCLCGVSCHKALNSH